MTNGYKLFILILINVLLACKYKIPDQLESVGQIETLTEIQQDSFDIKVQNLMKDYKVPGASFAFIRDGVVHATRTYGHIQKGSLASVSENTMFSVGSVSKVINALIILRLVNEETLKLDVDINQYLKGWKVDNNQYNKDNPVTLRAILSHTAGFSVHGFPDYLPEESVPDIIQTLNGEDPAKNDKVELVYPVGSKFQYSGGGITVSQKIVEDVTGKSYQEVAHEQIFAPLDLKRSSFENPLPKSWQNIAKAHNQNGHKVALPRGYQTMPEKAASGLWTTPTDLAKILVAFYNAKEEISNDFLSPQICEDMVTKVPPSNFGLGPGIATHRGEKLMQHAGSNDSYKAYFCFYYEKGFGFVACINSDVDNFIMKNLKVFEEQVRRIK